MSYSSSSTMDALLTLQQDAEINFYLETLSHYPESSRSLYLAAILFCV